MRGLDRRVVLLERAVLPRGDATNQGWDAALAALSTDELRALLAHVNGTDLTGVQAEHLERALGALERAGGAPAAAVAAMRRSAWDETGCPA